MQNNFLTSARIQAYGTNSDEHSTKQLQRSAIFKTNEISYLIAWLYTSRTRWRHTQKITSELIISNKWMNGIGMAAAAVAKKIRKNKMHRNGRRQNEIETVAIDTVSIKVYAECNVFLQACVNYYFSDTKINHFDLTRRER